MEGLWRMHSNMSSRLEALRVKVIIHTKQGYVNLALKTEEFLYIINIWTISYMIYLMINRNTVYQSFCDDNNSIFIFLRFEIVAM